MNIVISNMGNYGKLRDLICRGATPADLYCSERCHPALSAASTVVTGARDYAKSVTSDFPEVQEVEPGSDHNSLATVQCPGTSWIHKKWLC